MVHVCRVDLARSATVPAMVALGVTPVSTSNAAGATAASVPRRRLGRCTACHYSYCDFCSEAAHGTPCEVRVDSNDQVQRLARTLQLSGEQLRHFRDTFVIPDTSAYRYRPSHRDTVDALRDDAVGVRALAASRAALRVSESVRREDMMTLKKSVTKDALLRTALTMCVRQREGSFCVCGALADVAVPRRNAGAMCATLCLPLCRLGAKGASKAEAVVEQVLWLVRHTRQCPRCRVFVQRVSGCNHMSCNMCGVRFCWVSGRSPRPGSRFRACSHGVLPERHATHHCARRRRVAKCGLH